MQRGPHGGTLYHANSSMSELAIQEELAGMYAHPFDAASHQYTGNGVPALSKPSLAAALGLMERKATSMPSMGSSGLETITESDDEGPGYGAAASIWTRPVQKAHSWSGVVVPVGLPARVRPLHHCSIFSALQLQPCSIFEIAACKPLYFHCKSVRACQVSD